MIQNAVSRLLLVSMPLLFVAGCATMDRPDGRVPEADPGRTDSAQSAATDATALDTRVHGRLAHRDPDTGKLTSKPAPGQADLSAAGIDTRRWKPFVTPDGMRGISRPVEPDTVLMATRDEDGTIRMKHVSGAQGSDKVVDARREAQNEN